MAIVPWRSRAEILGVAEVDALTAIVPWRSRVEILGVAEVDAIDECIASIRSRRFSQDNTHQTGSMEWLGFGQIGFEGGTGTDLIAGLARRRAHGFSWSTSRIDAIAANLFDTQELGVPQSTGRAIVAEWNDPRGYPHGSQTLEHAIAQMANDFPSAEGVPGFGSQRHIPFVTDMGPPSGHMGPERTLSTALSTALGRAPLLSANALGEITIGIHELLPTTTPGVIMNGFRALLNRRIMDEFRALLHQQGLRSRTGTYHNRPSTSANPASVTEPITSMTLDAHHRTGLSVHGARRAWDTWPDPWSAPPIPRTLTPRVSFGDAYDCSPAAQPTERELEPVSCPICLMTDGEDCVSTWCTHRGCGQRFHVTCATIWHDTNSGCALCRQ